MLPVRQERDCEICGYPLRGLPKTAISVCPECGSVFDAVRPPSRLRFVAWGGVVVCLLTAHVSFAIPPHDEFGMPMRLDAGLAYILLMGGVMACSIAGVVLSRWLEPLSARIAIGFAVGVALCSVGSCMNFLMV
jgi:hypothetical protein